MKYIFKKGFTLEISNEKGGIVFSVNKNDFYYLLKNKVFKLIKGKWVLLNTKKINLKVPVKNKGIADLLEVASRYNPRMKFDIDEEYVLQALIFDLLFEPEKIKEWLPQGEEYIFEDGRLYVLKDGWLYEYDLPRALNEDVNSPLL
jgi:hypothetical protein